MFESSACQCRRVVVSGSPVYTKDKSPLSTKLTGNIVELRKLVDAKFSGGKLSHKGGKKVITRFWSKMPDTTGVYGRFLKGCLQKKPVATLETDVRDSDGWIVRTFLRKSGVQAGKSYKMFTSPQGTVYASQKKAVLAGFKVSMA